MTATKIRKSVPLTEEDRRDVALLREEAVYRDAYTAATGRELPDRLSEAEALHALLELGRSRLTEQVQLWGYAALAASQDDEDRQFEQARKDRRAMRARD